MSKHEVTIIRKHEKNNFLNLDFLEDEIDGKKQN